MPTEYTERGMLKYSEQLLERFKNPKHIGELENPTIVAQDGDPHCGDIFKLFLKIDDDRIVDAKFLSFGCAANIATGDMTVDLVKGKTIDEADKLQISEISGALGGLPMIKMHCAKLAFKTLKKAIAEYRGSKAGGQPQQSDADV